MNRIILHSDLNNFYASVECLYEPSLRGRPLAVAGDPQTRHGIVLAKSEEAKRFGVRTGDPLWLARQRCPDIVLVPPQHDLYLCYSHILRDLYQEYTDLVEPYGLDECWLDVSGSTGLFGEGRQIADAIRFRVKKELGLTVSVGVSYNKVFAKLGSDLRKPDATTVIDRQHVAEQVWPLPTEKLLYVGPSTQQKLKRYGIHTIGDLAKANLGLLEKLLGKNGWMLWSYANGLEQAPVSSVRAESAPKSIGNSITLPRDLLAEEEVKITFGALCEKVSSRLRKAGLLCRMVQIGMRGADLQTEEHQGKLDYPNRTAKSLLEKALFLYQNQRRQRGPIRSLSVRACNLLPSAYQQLSFLPEESQIQKEEELEWTIDEIRDRFGTGIIQRGVMLTDLPLSHLDWNHSAFQAERTISPHRFAGCQSFRGSRR